MNFSATYQSSPRKTTYRFKNNAIKKTIFTVKHPKSKTVQTVPFVTQIEMMNAPAQVQQFTHVVRPNRSYRLSYLLRHIADMARKIQQQKADKYKGKTTSKQTVHATKHSSFQKSNDFAFDRPRSNCLFSSVEAVYRCCRPMGSLANSSLGPACTFEAIDSPLSSTASGL